MSGESEELGLVVKLLFGVADLVGELREEEIAVICADKLIAGIRQCITNRPNGLRKSTKLDVLLPMMMDLAKWKEGFLKTSALKMKFELEGVNIRDKHNLDTFTSHDIDVSHLIIICTCIYMRGCITLNFKLKFNVLYIIIIICKLNCTPTPNVLQNII